MLWRDYDGLLIKWIVAILLDMMRGRYRDLSRNYNVKKWKLNTGWMMMWRRKRKDEVWSNLCLIPVSWNLADHFDSSFPAPSETFLSRIVARQVRVRMRNLATNAIQDITPRFADLLLYFLQAKIRWLPRHMNPNMNEWTLKKFSKASPHYKRKSATIPSSTVFAIFWNHNCSLENGWTGNMY